MLTTYHQKRNARMSKAAERRALDSKLHPRSPQDATEQYLRLKRQRHEPVPASTT